MISAFGIRYSDSVSVNGAATVDMEIGKEANMIGFGLKNKGMRSRATPGKFALVLPQTKLLKNTRKGYIHLVTKSSGIDVWKSNKTYNAVKAQFLGEIELTDEEIKSCASGRQIISNQSASKVVERFFKSQ